MSRVVAAARPVEYKKGPKRRFDNDEVQLCAQALCLEEMFGITVEAGAIFYAQSQRRLEIPLDDVLRGRTLAAISDLRTLISYSDAPAAISDMKSQISNPRIPAAELKPQCDGCSLHDVCLPELARSAAAWQSSEERLYTPIE